MQAVQKLYHFPLRDLLQKEILIVQNWLESKL